MCIVNFHIYRLDKDYSINIYYMNLCLTKKQKLDQKRLSFWLFCLFMNITRLMELSGPGKNWQYFHQVIESLCSWFDTTKIEPLWTFKLLNVLMIFPTFSCTRISVSIKAYISLVLCPHDYQTGLFRNMSGKD